MRLSKGEKGERQGNTPAVAGLRSSSSALDRSRLPPVSPESPAQQQAGVLPKMSVATPNLDHLTKADYEVVYDPAGASAL